MGVTYLCRTTAPGCGCPLHLVLRSSPTPRNTQRWLQVWRDVVLLCLQVPRGDPTSLSPAACDPHSWVLCIHGV